LSLSDFTDAAAELFVKINNLHPFREGNGRAQRFFLNVLAENAGHELAFDVVIKERMIEVSVAGIDGDVAGAKRLFREISDPSDRRLATLEDVMNLKASLQEQEKVLRELANMDEVDVHSAIVDSEIPAEYRWESTDEDITEEVTRAARFSLADYELQRDPDESDEDFASRRSLFR
jgi:hypothetical protein